MTERKIKVSAEDIENDSAFQYFKNKHDLSENTLAGYVNGFQRYVEYTGLSLTELIAEAEKEELERIPLEKRQIGKRLRGFRKHLKELQLAPASIKRLLAAVKSFYVNGYSITIPTLGKDRDLSGKVKIENKGIPSREDIIKVLEIADLREKAIILGITSSGLSIKDFLKLRVGFFKDGYDEETGITVLDLRRAKTQQDFVTFFSAEATEAFNEYLKWRNKEKPKTAHPDILKGWEKHRVFSDDDYLICKKYIPDKYLETKDEEIRKEAEVGLQTVFRHLANRAGIAREKGMWNMFRAHKLRSWFYTTLLSNGCKQEYGEVYMGHISKLGSSGGTYYTAIIPKLKEVYLEFMPHLSLLKPVETKVIESKGYRELKDENAALRQEIEAMKAREEAREPYDDKMTKIFEEVKADPEDLKLALELLKRMRDKGVL